jgi:hypothetical protein
MVGGCSEMVLAILKIFFSSSEGIYTLFMNQAVLFASVNDHLCMVFLDYEFKYSQNVKPFFKLIPFFSQVRKS